MRLLTGDVSLAFGDMPISFREVLTLHVCHRLSFSASRRTAARLSLSLSA
jgi:hypothetical protein